MLSKAVLEDVSFSESNTIRNLTVFFLHTADGKISRMSLMEDDLDIPEDTGPGCGLDSPTPDILETQLR